MNRLAFRIVGNFLTAFATTCIATWAVTGGGEVNFSVALIVGTLHGLLAVGSELKIEGNKKGTKSLFVLV